MFRGEIYRADIYRGYAPELEECGDLNLKDWVNYTNPFWIESDGLVPFYLNGHKIEAGRYFLTDNGYYEAIACDGSGNIKIYHFVFIDNFDRIKLEFRVEYDGIYMVSNLPIIVTEIQENLPPLKGLVWHYNFHKIYEGNYTPLKNREIKIFIEDVGEVYSYAWQKEKEY